MQARGRRPRKWGGSPGRKGASAGALWSNAREYAIPLWGFGGPKPKRAPSGPERAVPSPGPALGAYAFECDPRGAGSRELGSLNSLCAGKSGNSSK